jgi:hypothetical protein
MRIQLLFALPALLVGGLAAAQQTLPAIEVRGDTETVQVSCTQPDTVTADDVTRVLSIEDPTDTRVLRNKFIAVVAEACEAGVPHIMVTRGSHNDLSWKKME